VLTFVIDVLAVMSTKVALEKELTDQRLTDPNPSGQVSEASTRVIFEGYLDIVSLTLRRNL
jgi:hypothetical protein